MGCQGGAEAEGLTTFRADMAFLPDVSVAPLGVGPLVPVAVGAAAKALATLGTGKGFLTSVCEPVPIIVGAPGKALATDVALVGLLTPVQAPVSL